MGDRKNYNDRNKDELFQEAQKRGITGVSTSNTKDELVQALEQHDMQTQPQN